MWQMTPREWQLAVEGRRRAQEQWLELAAIHAAWIINHRTPAIGEKRRKPITPAQLLGRKPERSLEDSGRIWKAFVMEFQRPPQT